MTMSTFLFGSGLANVEAGKRGFFHSELVHDRHQINVPERLFVFRKGLLHRNREPFPERESGSPEGRGLECLLTPGCTKPLQSQRDRSLSPTPKLPALSQGHNVLGTTLFLFG